MAARGRKPREGRRREREGGEEGEGRKRGKGERRGCCPQLHHTAPWRQRLRGAPRFRTRPRITVSHYPGGGATRSFKYMGDSFACCEDDRPRDWPAPWQPHCRPRKGRGQPREGRGHESDLHNGPARARGGGGAGAGSGFRF